MYMCAVCSLQPKNMQIAGSHSNCNQSSTRTGHIIITNRIYFPSFSSSSSGTSVDCACQPRTARFTLSLPVRCTHIYIASYTSQRRHNNIVGTHPQLHHQMRMLAGLDGAAAAASAIYTHIGKRIYSCFRQCNKHNSCLLSFYTQARVRARRCSLLLLLCSEGFLFYVHDVCGGFKCKHHRLLFAFFLLCVLKL